MDFRRQIATLRSWLLLLVLVPQMSGTIVYFVTNLQPKVYEAQAVLIVGQSLSGVNPDYTQLLASQRLSSTYARIATLPAVLSGTIAELHLDATPEALAARVRADAPADTSLLTITAQDNDPARAAALANSVANQLITASPAVQGRKEDIQSSINADLAAIQEQIDSTQAQIDKWNSLSQRTPAQDAALVTLQGQLISLRSTYATFLTFASTSASNALSVVQPAVTPSAPVAPRPLLNAQLAALLGLLVAIGLVLGADYLKDAIKDADDVQETLGLSTLGTIGRVKKASYAALAPGLTTLVYPQSQGAEDYRTLRANIEFSSVDAPTATMLVAGVAGGERTTTTAANLGVVFAQAGSRVLLVDADLRHPGVHAAFDLPNDQGLTTLLRSDLTSLGAVAHASGQENLTILTSGPLPANPTELLGSQRMQAVLERLRAQFDLLIFDSPPLPLVSDAAVLSSFLGATILVVDTGRTRRRVARDARDALRKAGANVLGVALRGRPERLSAAQVKQYANPAGADSRMASADRASTPSSR